MPWLKRRCRQALITLSFLTLLAAPIAAYAEFEFYQASEQVIPGRPGTLIRQERMHGTPLGAEAFRVLYRSKGLKGEPIAVSGVVIIPPGGGRPIVAWAHPTTGNSPSVTKAHFKKLCAEGSRVRMLVLPGVGHGTIAMKSALKAVAWMADRFSEVPAENDCPEVRGDTQ